MALLERTISSWDRFVKIAGVLDLGSPAAPSYGFRGHSSKKWSLRHSLMRALTQGGRLDEPSIDETIKFEAQATKRFRAEAHSFLPPAVLEATGASVDWWTLMQHHGAPTRLIDWTFSPYVGAYFAAWLHPDEDGALYTLHTSTLGSAMQDKYGESFELPTRANAAGGYLTDRDAHPVIGTVERQTKTDRMVLQQGFFTVSRSPVADQEEVMTEAFSAQDPTKALFNKYIIPADQKPVFLRKLMAMNITAATLFPGIDGVGRSIDEFLRVIIQADPAGPEKVYGSKT